MGSIELDIESYLPAYLSQDAKKDLKEALENFANTHSGSFYTSLPCVKDELLQGDVWSSIPAYDYGDEKVRNTDVILLSNTCDMANEGSRLLPPNVTVAPVMKLEGYKKILLKQSKTKSEQDVEMHIDAIRDQKITHFFYLPDTGDGEKVAHLNRAFTLPVALLKERTGGNLATLNMLGFYVFIFKMSVHFCRLHEGVVRE